MSSRRVNKKALVVFVILVVVTIGLAWYFYKKKKGEASSSQGAGSSASTTTSYLPPPSSGGSSSSSASTPPPPPAPPTDPYIGKRLIATQDGVKVYNPDFKTVYKTVNKGGWIGIVADSTKASWYKITTTSGTAYVLKSQSRIE